MAWWMVVGLVCSFGMTETEKSIALFDFEATSAVDRWIPSQGARVRVESVDGADGSAKGHALIIESPKAGIVATSAKSVPSNWSEFEQLAFRARRARGAGPLTFEVWVVEADKKTKFWRKFVVESDEWKQFELPIRYLRWGSGRIPNPSNIDRIAFFARDTGSIAIDDIVLRDDPDGPGARVPLAELADLAFANAKDTRIVTRDRLELATDCSELDVEEVADRLEEVIARVCTECGLEVAASQRPRMLVFAAEDSYRSFPTRYAAKFDSNADPPKSNGFTFLGVATSFFDPATGAKRPVFSHEIVHSVLSNAGWIDNGNEWLQEGVASWIQLQFHRQSNWSEIVTRGLDNEDSRLPLERLLDGKRIPDNRYWQAASVVDYLMHGSGKFKPLLAAMAKSGSTAIEPHLGPILATDFTKLNADWVSWCREHYTR